MFRITLLLSALLCVALPSSAQQTPAPPSKIITGVGAFSHIVASLDKSLEFYHDMLGLELTAPPRPFDGNPAIMKMGNTPGAQSRPVVLRIPGSTLRLELIEYKDIDRKPLHPRFYDPGAANLILQVRDLDPLMAKFKKAGVHVVTPGAAPVSIGQGANSFRVVFVQDPDGFFVELGERKPAPATTAPESSNVIGGNCELMINDTAATLKVYKALGFEPKTADAFDGDKTRNNTVGAPGASYLRSAGTLPGSNVSLAFLEFKGIDRKPLSSRVQDPGTAVLQLRVSSVDAAIAAATAAGATVVSEGGKAVELAPGRKLVILRDPNNVFLELIEAPPPASK